MHKYLPKFYHFIDNLNIKNIQKLDKNIALIYRNYKKKPKKNEVLKFKINCKKKKIKFLVSNYEDIVNKYNLDGFYIPSFNKQINYCRAFSLPKSFKILGSAHNIKEIIVKQKQLCNEVFLSPVFKVLKTKKYLGVINVFTLHLLLFL